MTARIVVPILILAALGAACEPMTAPDTGQSDPVAAVSTRAQSAQHVAASGTYAQSAITGLDVRLAGPNTVIEQTSIGSMAGTLNGSFEDDVRVVIHPNGRFNAQFTITCECTVDGKQGVLELRATDTGELVGPGLATFAGRAVVRGGTGELSGLRGVLAIEGTVDLATGLATTSYSGDLHFRP